MVPIVDAPAQLVFGAVAQRAEMLTYPDEHILTWLQVKVDQHELGGRQARLRIHSQLVENTFDRHGPEIVPDDNDAAEDVKNARFPSS